MKLGAVAMVVMVAACSKATVPAESQSTSPIPAATTQLITGVTDDWTSTTATLQLWTP